MTKESELLDVPESLTDFQLRRHPFAKELRRERRAAKKAADYFVLVCQAGNAAELVRVTSLLDETVGSWPAAMQAVVKRLLSVSPAIQQAFLQIWIEHKMLPRTVGDHPLLCDAIRVLLPSYRGPPLRLYRGAGAHEALHQRYGMCWTADVTVADQRFAQERRHEDGGSVVLETLAPAEAIICKIAYPEPFTFDELQRNFPDLSPSAIQTLLDNSKGFHEECEYVVDSRHLGAVDVVRRYAQLPIPEIGPRSSSGG